jgi:putative ABC transport system substrate-binding protein
MGYIEGQNLVIEYRSGKGALEPLPALAAELVRLPVDVLLTTGIAATLAAKEATSTIPIVFNAVNDPIGMGLITSWAKPGGHITGVAAAGLDFNAGKLVELLKEVVPAATRVAVLVDPDNPVWRIVRPKMLQDALQGSGVHLHFLEVRQPTPEALERAFATLAQEGVEALYIGGDRSFDPYRTQLVELVAATRLPAIYADAPYVQVGGLMAYNVDWTVMLRRAGIMVGKILGGAKPADIPAEYPTKFRLTINLKTAQALGITIPPSLLLLADEVIQ